MRSLAFPALWCVLLAAAAPGCNNSPAAQSAATAEDTVAGDGDRDATVDRSAASNGEAGNRVLETSFDDIKFEMASNDQFVDEMITPEIERRFDRRIRIRGYMFPTLRETGLKQFVLVRDNLECCFGPGAALFDCILVYMREGVTADYSVRPVTVEGKFRFEKLRAGPDGPLMAIYRLNDAHVE